MQENKAFKLSEQVLSDLDQQLSSHAFGLYADDAGGGPGESLPGGVPPNPGGGGSPRKAPLPPIGAWGF
jgi:hypothetical protein